MYIPEIDLEVPDTEINKAAEEMLTKNGGKWKRRTEW